MTTTPNLAAMHGVNEITATEVKTRLERGDDLLLLDVREQQEWDYCHLEGAVFAPMSRFLHYMADLDPERPTVVYCHAGVRSVFVTAHLQNQGFADVVSMAGGIDGWSREVDPSVPRYGHGPAIPTQQVCRR